MQLMVTYWDSILIIKVPDEKTCDEGDSLPQIPEKSLKIYCNQAEKVNFRWIFT